MPVVPAPADEEIPRIEIALVPELSMVTPGVKRTMSLMSLMPRRSIASWVSAVTLIGTLLSSSSRRVAVTTTSCSKSPRGAAPPPVVAGASGPPAPVALAASSASAEGGANPSRQAAASGRYIRQVTTRFEFLMANPPVISQMLRLQQHRCIGAPAYKHFIVPVYERLGRPALVLRKHGHELSARDLDLIRR